jgi:DegV family protein with EDD domain
MVKIITDSTSDLTMEMARELGVTMLPLTVTFGKESYVEQVDITPAEFFDKLQKSSVFPTTSGLPTGVYVQAYDKAAEESDEVLVLTLPGKLSTTYESAIKALELRKRKDCRIEVIDTNTVIGGLGLLVIMAAEEARRGANLDQLVAMIKKYMPKVHFRVCFDTLEYLHRGGRIGSAQAFMGSILKINPIVGVIDGLVEGVARTRSRKKALDWLYDFATGFKNVRILAVEHSAVPDEAEIFMRRLAGAFPEKKIHQSMFSPVVGAHVGPHAIGVALVEEVEN